MSYVQTVRKKPVEVQAIRVPTYPSDEYVSVYLYQEDAGDVASWCGGRQLMSLEDDDTTAYGDVIVTGPHIAIATLEGTMVALPGDWIIQGVQGEFYPCKPDIFAATYDDASTAPPASETEWVERVGAVIDVFENCDDDADPGELRPLVLAALKVSGGDL